MTGRRVTWVVGAGGLLGRHVARRLRHLGDEVLTTTIPWDGPDAGRAALRDGIDELARAAGSGAWRIAWCAGAGVVASSGHGMRAEQRTFVAFLTDLARLGGSTARGTFLLSSSAGGVYAGSADPPFTERTLVRPLTAYGAVKLAMENDLSEMARSTGMRAVIARIANLYGPGQDIDKPQGLVSHLCRSRYSRTPTRIHVPLDTLRDYLFVTDCAQMLAAALECRHPAEDGEDPVAVKIMASGRSISVVGLIEEVRRVLRRHPRVLVAPALRTPAQTLDLRLRSVVWPGIDAIARTPLPVGIAATAADVGHRLESQRRCR